jgi:hypothetical protein
LLFEPIEKTFVGGRTHAVGVEGDDAHEKVPLELMAELKRSRNAVLPAMTTVPRATQPPRLLSFAPLLLPME